MCGIYGAINYSSFLSNEEIDTFAKNASGLLKHRGPDDSNYFKIDDNVLLGHTRLSIIDFSGGSQPMSNENEDIWVTFNGEIYNYVELKKDLLDKGYKFRSSSDTEVLIALYEFYGVEMLNYLNGMFAFCLYDLKEKKTILARDRFGEKPLYYSFVNNQLIFGSELKIIKSYPYLNFDKDYKALGQFLALGYIPAPRTHLKSIKKLGPSQYILYNSKYNIKIEKYWKLEPAEESIIKPSDAIDGIKDLLIDSLKIRLRSDVPVASFLSGGIDSSIVCSLIKNHFNREIKTICVSFENKLLDEGKYANIVSNSIGSDHIDSKYGNENIKYNFNKLINHIDEPFGDYSIFPTSQACEVAKKLGYTVMMSGDGADEIFGGYSIWYLHYNWSWLKKYNFVNYLSKHLLKSYGGRGAGVLKLLSEDGKIRYNSKNLKFFKYTNPELNENLVLGLEEINFRNNKYNFFKFPKNQMHSSLLEFYLPEQVLVKVDRASMYNSVECRTPFLDHRLVEFVNMMPADIHYGSNNGKILFISTKKQASEVVAQEATRCGGDVRVSVHLLLLMCSFVSIWCAERDWSCARDEKKGSSRKKRGSRFAHCSSSNFDT